MPHRFYLQKDIPGLQDFILAPFSFSLDDSTLFVADSYKSLFAATDLSKLLGNQTGFHILARPAQVNNIRQSLFRQGLQHSAQILEGPHLSFWAPLYAWAECPLLKSDEVFHTCFNATTHDPLFGQTNSAGPEAVKWWLRFFESQATQLTRTQITTHNWLKEFGYNMEPKE